MMWELLDQYREKFGEQFPMMLFRGFDESEIIKVIEKCIKNDQPYEPKLQKGADY